VEIRAALEPPCGLRHTEVSFYSRDYFIVGSNPTTAADPLQEHQPCRGPGLLGFTSLNLYGNVGKGFETPTSQSSPTAPTARPDSILP